MKMKVINLPDNYTNYGWIVCTECEGQLWFFDGWKKEQERDARTQSWEIPRGHCYPVNVVERGYYLN